MSLQRITKQLQRDIKRNPQKAGLLALLLAVMVWFWLPLLIKDDSGTAVVKAAPKSTSEQPATSTSSTAVVASDATAAASSTTGGVAPATDKLPKWQDVIDWIAQDAAMRPIGIGNGSSEIRNPFVVWQAPTVVVSSPMTEADETSVAVVQPTKSPEDLGLTLSGTIIGRNRQTATINGLVYVVGELVEANERVVFQLASVEPNRVLLDHNGLRYELVLRRGQRSGRIELRGGN